MKRVYSIYFFIFLCAYSKSFAQEIYSPTTIVPPSPTAASLGEFGKTPVNYYTGSPNIALPVMAIKTNTHEFSLNLKYLATGIRITQDASWVGLGWALNGIGVITRTVRGKNDFSSEGYYYTNNLPPSDQDDNYTGIIPDAINGSYFGKIFDNMLDSEPDIFHFNLGGQSGSFVIDKLVNGGAILFREKTSIKMEFNPQTELWVIYTPNGYKYEFGTQEKSEVFFSPSEVIQYQGLTTYSGSSEGPITTAWYLDKVTSPTGEEITFEYEKEFSISTVSRSQTRYDNVHIFYNDLSGLSGVYNYFKSTRQLTNEVYLKRVNFKTGYIILNKSLRIDVEKYLSSNPSKLDNIRLYNLDNEILKEVCFEYSYFNNNYSLTLDNLLYKRLKLNAVHEYGRGGKTPGAEFLKHEFDYEGDNTLPAKNSNQFDRWGFFATFPVVTINGEIAPSLLPPASVLTPFPVTTKTFSGTVRTPDQNGNIITKGMLNKVKYPTGGYTTFKFEPHDYPETSILSDTTRQLFANVYANPEFAPSESLLSQEFTISSTQNVTFTLKYYELPWTEEPFGPPLQYSAETPVVLKNKQNSQIIRQFVLEASTGYNLIKTVMLTPGQYIIEIPEIPQDYTISMRVTGPIQITSETLMQNIKGGGVRLKETSDYNENNKLISKKSLSYIENGRSTGRLIAPEPEYYLTEVIIRDEFENNMRTGHGVYLVRSSSNNIFSSGFSSTGVVLGYNKVIVKEEGIKDIGQTEFSFFNESSSSPYTWNNSYPGAPQKESALNGKMQFIRIKNSNLQTVSTTEFEYEQLSNSNIKGVKLYTPTPAMNNQDFGADGFSFAMSVPIFYSNSSEWWVKSKEITTIISNGNTAQTQSQFYYENPSHKQITKTETYYPDGKIMTNRFKYPHDFINQPVYADMVNIKNLVAVNIEKAIYNGTELQETKRVNYNNWGNGLFAPGTIEMKQGLASFETRFQIDEYDINGNVLTSGEAGDVKTSYVWGYNKSLPVVKAENVTNADLNSKVNLVLIELGYMNGIQELDNFLINLGDMTTSGQLLLWNQFNQELREKFIGQNVLISCYAANNKNLFSGLTATSDINGNNIYYKYDDFGRLIYIKDNEGNILKSYNYKIRQ